MSAYIGILRKDPDSDYGVDFPDFPGCITAGATLEETRMSAAEALELHIGGMIEDGVEIPAPSSLDEVMADRSHRDGVAFLVEVEDPNPRYVRVNVTFKQAVLSQIDEYAADRRMTRAGFLEKAALRALGE